MIYVIRDVGVFYHEEDFDFKDKLNNWIRCKLSKRGPYYYRYTVEDFSLEDFLKAHSIIQLPVQMIEGIPLKHTIQPKKLFSAAEIMEWLSL